GLPEVPPSRAGDRRDRRLAGGADGNDHRCTEVTGARPREPGGPTETVKAPGLLRPERKSTARPGCKGWPRGDPSPTSSVGGGSHPWRCLMRKQLIGLGLAGALSLGLGWATTARADDNSASEAAKSANDQAQRAAGSADEAA